MSVIKNNIIAINQQIAHYCSVVAREKNCVTLLAVSKTKPSELIEQAYQVGQRYFGENYVQEAVEKIKQLKHLSDISWHFIGPIQSNKTKTIAQNFSWVHSVDRIKIAKRLHEQSVIEDNVLNVCLQVNISKEPTKSGTSIEALQELADFVASSSHLQLRGIMAIPEKNAPRESYQQMQSLYLALQKQYSTIDTLSMGMSDDIEQAIASGSTMVRIGSAIFGARN